MGGFKQYKRPFKRTINKRYKVHKPVAVTDVQKASWPLTCTRSFVPHIGTSIINVYIQIHDVPTFL